jgi:hypothetical protein
VVGGARTIGRVRWRYEHYGYEGLLDRPPVDSPHRAGCRCGSAADFPAISGALGRVRCGVLLPDRLPRASATFSYTLVKLALRGMELWPRAARAGATAGAAAVLGELLHLDGSLTALRDADDSCCPRLVRSARSTAGTLLTTTRLEEPAASNQIVRVGRRQRTLGRRRRQ